MIYTPHVYQDHATEHLLTNMYAALFLDMGLGKTVSSLTAINTLMFDTFEAGKVLVIAPKTVAESTWHTEGGKWDHLKHLTFSIVLGSEKARIAALEQPAHIYIINRENVAWLAAYYGLRWPFDTVIIDELSSFKNPKSQRFKALRQIRPRITRVWGLTGTPAPNGLIDLWSQIYLLDQGERLGKTITSYRDNYFKPDKRNGSVVYSYKIRNGEEEIYSRIGDICISMKAKDWLELPGRTDILVQIPLSDADMKLYNDFERDQVLALGDEEINAINAAALSTKLRQFANGAVYREDKTYYVVHDAKLDRLAEDVEALNGKPVIIFYSFKHDLERILVKLKAYNPRVYKGDPDRRAWDRGEIQIMLCHPASAGHGLNLQYGGNHIFWYGLPWSLELYQQACARVDRQGQTQVVINRIYLTINTVDQDVIAALEDKDAGQQRLLEATKARIQKYRS